MDRPEAKRSAVVELVKSQNLKQVIVFTNTKIGAGRLARELQKEGISADAIHGDKSQSERLATLDRFKKGEVEVMVATDVAARGLDIAELPAVINYDLPYSPEDYIHRIGRTGRAGASGRAMSLMAPEDQRYLTEIEKLIRKTIDRERLSVRPSGSRSSGSRPSASRIAPVRPVAGATAASGAAADPIFSQPYESKPVDPATAAAKPAPPAAGPIRPTVINPLAGIRRTNREVPAILGGKPKATS